MQQILKEQDDELYKDSTPEGTETDAISRSLGKGSRGSRGLSLLRKSRSASRSVRDHLEKNDRADDTDVEMGDKIKKKRVQTSLLRLAKYSKPEFPYFVAGCFSSLASGTTFLLFGLFLSNLIATYYIPDHKKLRHNANFWSLMFLVMAIGIFIVAPIQFTSFAMIGQRLIRRLRRLTFDKVVRNEVA